MKIILILLLSISLFAKDFSIDEYKFKYSFDIGGEPTFAAIQDKYGFLWFGSFFSGLVRYDGTHVKKYRAGKESITNDSVTQIFEDSRGILWIGSSHGLTAYDRVKNSFTQYFAPAIVGNSFAFSSATIIEEKDGTLWFGTLQGISKLDPESGKFIHFQHNAEHENSLSSNEIYSIFLDSKGTIWIGTKNDGLNRYNKETNDFTRFPYKANDIHSIVEDKNDNLWLGSKQKGLIFFDKKNGSFKLFDEKDGLPKMEIWDLIVLKNGYIALTSSIEPVGLVLFNPETKIFSQQKVKKGDSNSLSTNSLHTILEDKFGTTWVTHNNGKVDKYDPKLFRFKLYKHNKENKRSIASNTPIPIYEDKNKNIWIGYFGAGLDLYDKKSDDFKHFKPKKGDKTTIPHGYPSGFFEDKDGNLIVSTAKGMVVFDAEKGKVTKVISTDTWFYTIIADHKDPDVVWANGWESGFNRFNLKTGERKQYKHDVNDPQSFSSVNSVRFIEDKDDNNIFWIATWGGGMDRFDKRTEEFTHFTHDPTNKKSILSNSVFDVLEDSRGLFWVCTNIGLNLFDKKDNTFEPIKMANARTIHNIQEDNAHSLWFATDIGLVHFDPIKKEVIKIYTKEDGLHSHDFFATSRAKMADGQFWYGGFNGLNSFYPSTLKDNLNTPNIFLTSMKQDGKEIKTKQSFEALKHLELKADKNYFEFEYVGLNFTNSQKDQYQYFLEGYDKDWYDAKNRQIGRYVNLPSGEYTLRIKGSNNDGYWSKKNQEVALKILVDTPWYKMTVAYFLYILFFALFIYLIFRWQINRVKNQNTLLENKVKEQTKDLTKQLTAVKIAEQQKDELFVKAQEATKSKSEFLANMSHEIRTPMNGIIGMTHLALQTELNDKQKNYLQKVDNSAKSLLGIINDILDFSKIEAGKLTIEKIDFDLYKVIDNVVQLVENQVEAKKLELIVSYAQDVGKNYFGDSLRISQIITNLLSNAVKFTSEGEIGIYITKVSDNRFRFEIKDSGIGLTPEQVGKLFKSFSQADGSTTRKYGGTGLGLTISKQLTELMGGKIWVESEVGVGSSFIFEIDLEEKEDKKNYNVFGDDASIQHSLSETNKSLKDEMQTLGGSHILLTEDNETNQDIILGLLEDSGIHIDIANDGQEAVNTYSANPGKYELVLMDLQMPVMDGYEATKRIREMNSEIPIIALTANAMVEDIERTKSAGMNAHLNKPIEVEKLYATLLKFLSKKQDAHSTIEKAVEEEIVIPGFQTLNANIALDYLAGNKKLFLSLLADFYKRYKGIDLETMQDDEFARVTHTLKGLSANLGAQELNTITAKLDKTQDRELLPEFNRALARVLNELEKTLLKEDASPSNEGKEQLSQEKREALVRQLKEALESMEPEECSSIILEFSNYHLPDEEREVFNRITHLIDEYDFDEALELLQG